MTCTVGTDQEGVYEVGYDLTTGEQKWKINAPDYLPSYHQAGGEGVVFYWIPTTMKWEAHDAETGQYLYVTDSHDPPYGMYTDNGAVAYGKYIVPAYDGCVHAFDVKTGKQVWKFSDGNAGLETPYGTWPFQFGPIIAGGVVFAANGEHSPEQPSWRGARLYAIDADTGENIWNISGMWPIDAIADGYLVSYNTYDNRLYTFGKGPSAIEVSVPDAAQPLGLPILIKGTVTDQSPAQKGTPAISDEDMGPWMEYLNMQAQKPTNAKGVPVHLTAIDPNGNFQDMGIVTSDMAGMFKKSWIPPVPGEYTITATFEGSEAYGGSAAETALLVVQAPSAAIETPKPSQPTIPTGTASPPTTIVPLPTEPVQPPTGQMPTFTYIAIGAVVIVIVSAAAAIVLRRRK
jgi:hypothetical protein